MARQLDSPTQSHIWGNNPARKEAQAAKIGNEAKLILKLARERVPETCHTIGVLPSWSTHTAYEAGWRDARRKYGETLDAIVAELEH